jgi:hypothetical protein
LNAFAQQLLGVAKGYLGPAAQTFLSAEFQALGVNANTIGPAQLEGLVERVRVKATRAMGDERASELASALAACGATQRPAAKGHRLASDAAAKLLESGLARHAETAYRELANKHGDIEAFCGLARAHAAQQDVGAALATLRDGAAKFAGAGDRASAVALLLEAVAIAPADLAAHRRLAAALANQGDLPSAIREYARFVDVNLAQKDTRRAWLELAYGRETLGDLPGLRAIVDRIAAASGGLAGPAPRPPVASSPTVPSPMAMPRPAALSPQAVSPAARTTKGLQVETEFVAKGKPLGQRTASEPTTRPSASQTTVVLKGASTVTHAEQGDFAGPIDLLARAGFSQNGHTPRAAAAPARPARPPLDMEQEIKALVPTGNDLDAANTAGTRATLLIGMRDKRATDATLDAARRLLSLGKLQSASDLLLDYIAHGFTDREAQRLLIEVDCAIGRRDTAKEKCHLLSYAYRLDGRTDVAEDVDRIARIL